MIFGSREARPTFFRRLVARAAARELDAFVVPGLEIARARGLDLAAAGLRPSGTPRHASVLVLVGGVPEGLKKAAAVAYAQMPRPRAILAVGAGDVSSLPEPDVSVPLGQEELAGGVAALRSVIAEGAFAAQVYDFDVDEIRTQTEYVCPMHPEVVSDEPGSCPKCGMALVPREAAGGTGHAHLMHSGHGGDATGGHGTMDHGGPHAGHGSHVDTTRGGTVDEAAGHGEHGGEDVDRREHEASGAGVQVGSHEQGADHSGVGHVGAYPAGQGAHGDDEGHGGHGGQEGGLAGHAEYGPYASVEHGEHRGAPEDHAGHGGMDHDQMDHGDHAGHDGHDHMDHGDGMGFMSMVAMTQGTPRSSDGLQMEWVEVPFGPLFPGLPAGLRLRLTLDGDTVAGAEAGATVGPAAETLFGSAGGFAERLHGLDPLSPVACRLLAVQALEEAFGLPADEETALARAGALERERAASHLNWLASFAHLLGYAWLEGRAARLQLALLRAAGAEEDTRLRGEVSKLARRVGRTPLLRRKLRGIGRLPGGAETLGPVARAGGTGTDARAEDEVYRAVLGFEPVLREGDDAFSRLLVRLEEAERSLDLVRRAGRVAVPTLALDGAYGDGSGVATVETPRGAATLRVTLQGGEVKDLGLETPSARHMGSVGAVTDGEELANALVGVASLDLSPWEVAR